MTGLDDFTLYDLTAALGLSAAFLMAAALAIAWPTVRRRWRGVLATGLLQEAAIAYACVQAESSQVPIESRLVVLALALSAFVAALVVLVVVELSERHGRTLATR